MNINKFLLIILIVLFIFLTVNSVLAVTKCTTDNDCKKEKGTRCDIEKGVCARMLELVYPKIPGASELITIKTGVSNLVKYLFNFGVIIIGFIIFGNLVVSGIIYSTSSGDPQKTGKAISGIRSSIFGAVILLVAVLGFKTINPSLVMLELPKASFVPGVITPGLYVCNYKSKENIEDFLNKYISPQDTDEQLDTVKKIKDVIIDPTNQDNKCFRLNFSGNFENFTVKKNNTMFIIPTLKINPVNSKLEAKYEYGIVLHEGDNFKGRCDYYIYDSKEIFYNPKNLPFTKAKSYTLFKKLEEEPLSDAKGVELYSCLMYNESQDICSSQNVTSISKSFKAVNDFLEVSKASLGDLAGNTRSVKIFPQGSYFAIAKDKENDNERPKCAILKENDPDITNLALDTGSSNCNLWSRFTQFIQLTEDQCIPNIQSMTVIKGQSL